MKITIITVCYNSEKNGKHIEDTLKSVLKQTYKNYEYLIIDGKSTDNTLDIVHKYEKKFQGKMRVISEKDKGIYDAMNKGIKLATGDIIGIINSDDVLIDKDVFKRIIENYTPETDILYADLLYCDNSLKKIIRNYQSGPIKSLDWCGAHPTMYIRKKVFKKSGSYNLKYKTAADYDLMVRLNKAHYNFTYLKDYLVLMRLGGASNGFKGYLNDFKDAYHILKDNHVNFPFLRTLKRCVKTVISYMQANKKDYTLK